MGPLGELGRLQTADWCVWQERSAPVPISPYLKEPLLGRNGAET